MSQTKYPVVVETLDAVTAIAIYCEACGWKGKQPDPSDGPINDVGACPRCDLMTLDYCYVEGERCSGCGALGINLPLTDQHGHYCTRACLLQAEYARSLSSNRTKGTE